MKKTVLMLLVAVLLLSAFPAVSAGAAGEGPFLPVYSASQLETVDENGKTKDGKTVPLAGYYYDDTGFHMKSPLYSESSAPFTQIAARDPLDLTRVNDVEGHVISMAFTVDSFLYDGAINKDEWICLSVTNRQNVVPGGASYQDGLFLLIRGKGLGSAKVQPHLDSENTFKDCSSAFATVEVPVNSDGREMYTFTVDYDGTGWKIFVNDVDVTPADVVLSNGETLNSIFSSFRGEAYVNITVQTGYVDTDDAAANAIELSINKYNSLVPIGDDSAEPKNDDTHFAPVADSASVPANQPAILWDSHKTTFTDYSGMGITFADNADGSVHLKVDESIRPYVVWNVKPEFSYKAEDFPIVVMATRSLLPDFGNTYYCAGSVLTPEENYRTEIFFNDWELGGDWYLSFIDLDYLWDGRINALRIGFNFDDVMDDLKQFDIGFIGCFRNEEEGKAFAYEYLKPLGLTETVYHEPPVTPVVTEPKTEPVTVASVDPVTDPVTDAPGPETDNPAPVTMPAQTASGCGSALALSALLPLLGAAYVLRKKH